MSKEIQTEINFDELIDHITIIPDKYYRTADILFGKYMINVLRRYNPHLRIVRNTYDDKI